MGLVISMDPKIRDRLLGYVKKAPGCWEWLACKDKRGYGRLSLRNPRRVILAHRGLYEIYKGPIPDGLCVCHHCDNPGCVNPDHLFVGTQKDNIKDMMSKGRHKTLRGSSCGGSILTEEQVLRIRAAHKDGTHSLDAIAKEYKVCRSTIESVVYRNSWKHV